jgi:glycosyltransferase involved in cell wall biosynthesis
MTVKMCMVVRQYYLTDPIVQRQANAIVEAGGEADVICLRAPGQPARQTYKDVRIYSVPISRRRQGVARYLLEYLGFFVFAFFLISLLFAQKGYDIIEVHPLPDFLVFAALLPKLFGKPVVLNMRDPMPELYMSKFRAGPSHLMIRFICLQERFSWKFADHVLTVHDPMRDLLVARGLPPHKISVVLNTPDETVFCREVGKDAKGTSDRDRAFTLLFAGTVAERHGVDTAIKGLAILKDQVPNIRLVIVGEGDHLPCLQELVQSMGLESWVEFRSPVPVERIPDIILTADVGVSPIVQSSYSDLCLSTKVLEWLQMGLPVVASRTKAMMHYLDGSIFFFEPESVAGFVEQVRACYADPDAARDKVASAQAILREIGWHVQQKKYLAIIRDLATVRKRVTVGC